MILRLLLILNFFPSIQVAGWKNAFFVSQMSKFTSIYSGHVMNEDDTQAKGTEYYFTENKILVKQSPMLVVYNKEVNLSCNYTYDLFSKEFRASLYKGADSAVEVCVVHGNYSHRLQFQSNTGFNCDGKIDNETVTFYLWNLYANHTDIYFCKIEVMYPPPYIDNEKSNGTIILVKENHLCPLPWIPGSPKPFWALVVVIGVLAFYSVVVTVALYAYWIKNRRNCVLQSDYMNMTPRRPGLTRRHYQPYAPARDFAAYRS